MGGKKKVLRTVRSLLRLSKSRSVSGFGKEVSSEILSEVFLFLYYNVCDVLRSIEVTEM